MIRQAGHKVLEGRFVWAPPLRPATHTLSWYLSATMFPSDIEDILISARERFNPKTAPALLSSILHIFFRERSRPLDPDYVTEAACAALLTKQSGLYALLEKAVTDGNGHILWDCGVCHIVIVTPRVR